MDASFKVMDMEKNNKAHGKRLHTWISWVLLLGMLAWNIFLQCEQYRHSKLIDRLKVRNQKIEDAFIRDVRGHSDIVYVTADLQSGSELASSEVQIEPILERMRRDTPANRNSTRAGRRKGGKKNSKRGAYGAHFAAYVDRNRLHREESGGRHSKIGWYNKDGFVPGGEVYSFWKTSNWTDKTVFDMDETSGIVKVKTKGYYLIYAQIVYHGAQARKSFGIHINNQTVPYVESLAFDRIGPVDARNKRRTERSGLGNGEMGRNRRQQPKDQYSSYSQCNTMAVTLLNEGDEVFIKAGIGMTNRSIIAQSYLTFWGMARL